VAEEKPRPAPFTVPYAYQPPAVAPTTERPWTPNQIFGVCFLFGAVAGGVIAGLNFARMGKRPYLIPCIVAGSLLFLTVAGVGVFLLPEELAHAGGLLLNGVIGLGFLLVQKPYFDVWRMTNWSPESGTEHYWPGRLGQLFLISLACLAIEVGVLFLLILCRW
jgi:hypothetical protein